MTETVNFLLYLSVGYTDVHPQYTVYVDDQQIDLGSTLNRPRIPFEKKFSVDLDPGKHQLIIDTNNSVSRNSTITLFNIIANKFKCNTNSLMTNNCKFVTQDGKEHPIKNIPTVISDNGKLVFEFESPFAYWALEQL